MTKQEAKDFAIEIEEYLVAHPKIDSILEIKDYDLRERILGCLYWDPLCAALQDCSICPLNCCLDRGSDFRKWLYADDPQSRKAAAKSLLAKIRAWEV